MNYKERIFSKMCKMVTQETIIRHTVELPKKCTTHVRKVIASKDFDTPLIFFEIDDCEYLSYGSPNTFFTCKPLDEQDEYEIITNPVAIRIIVIEHNDVIANLCRIPGTIEKLFRLGINIPSVFVKTIEVNGKKYELYNK